MDTATVARATSPEPPARRGRGGRRVGAGRRTSYRRPVRVLVTLEASELEAVEARWPGLSRSQALRRAVCRGLVEQPGAESEEAGDGVGDSLNSDTEIKDADKIAVTPSDAAPSAVEDAPREPAEEMRTVRMTFEQSRMIYRKVMSDRETGLEMGGSWYWGLGLPTCPERGGLLQDTFEHELSLKDCRTLRRAINRWLRSTDERLARVARLRAQEIKNERWKPRGQRLQLASVEVVVERQRREFRKLNGKVRRVLKGIPWR